MSMPESWVRGAVLVHINSLVRHSAVYYWELLEKMIVLLHEDITPYVPLRGSILASGGMFITLTSPTFPDSYHGLVFSPLIWIQILTPLAYVGIWITVDSQRLTADDGGQPVANARPTTTVLICMTPVHNTNTQLRGAEG